MIDSANEMLRTLYAEGGKIVLAEDLSGCQIQAAKEAGLYYEDDVTAIGFAIVNGDGEP